MSSHEEIADVLDGAADVIERDGWHQGGYFPGASPYTIEVSKDNRLPKCAHGALLTTTEDRSSREFLAADTALVRVIRTHVPHWNDAPERTKQEVLDALRYAAKSERRAADEVA